MDTLLTEYNEEGGGKKRLSVERIYQRKTQLEHILLRPDTYIGSVEETTELMWVFDDDKKAIVQRQISYVPGLYKIFDEILVNAADNKQRDPKMNAIKITIDAENNVISVWNNGAGIPVEMHATEKLYVPELIFGTLLTSSNYDDVQKKVTGGRNGYGAKLCNIFSTEFTIETASSESGKQFKQTWKNNMGVSGKNIVTAAKKDFTKVVYKPDLSKFKMTHLNKDIVSLMTRRAYDIAGCTKGVSVYLNGEKLPVKSFQDYVELYLKAHADEDDLPRKVVHEVVNPRWEVCVTASSSGFKQSSFVNSIATTKGGTHVNAVVEQLVSKLLEAAKKKNKGGMELKPLHIKSHLWVFVNCLIENPTFDSQTKETMTLKAKSFGSTCQLGDKFIKSALGCGVIERVLNWARAKSQTQLNKKQHGSKSTKLKGIAKLDDANDAGSKNSQHCTLIVTEGDSAKSLAVSGLGVIGRDQYGVFPLRGKLLNVREATHSQIMNNEEVKNIIKILGLQYGKNYSSSDELKGLRYGHIMIMADQDQDGSHIKGLVINFFHYNWPQLLRHGFIEEFITPIVKAVKGKQEKAFFSLPEFEQWRNSVDNIQSWKIKYYKGLGTSTSKEAKEYFSDMDLHRIPFAYEGSQDDKAIELAFSKKLVEERKEWLTSWLETRRTRRSEGLNESYLYGERTESVTYSDFINKELILFSNMDNERSIPNLVDGFKPGQRKVMFTCFKRNDKRDIKVAQLAGSVAEHSAYHHGEQSLMGTIINLAQNYVGSNNINVLQPIGQFGTRLHGGKDAASPRYIFTMLSPLARHIFPLSDDRLLTSLYDDNQRIEPEWYCPILPMILVNGTEGIGTGYSTNVPNFNPREIVTNLKRMMNGMEPEGMKPWYKNFQGTIAPVEPHKYMVFGQVGLLSSTSFEITELPLKTWTQSYKENVLEPLLYGNDKTPPFISDYKEYHTDVTVKFVVTLTEEKMREAQACGIHKKFKLVSTLLTSNMVLFDADGCLKKYDGELDILREFFDTRLSLYHKRKDYLEGQLTAESLRLQNQARFIMEKIERKLIVEDKRKNALIDELVELKYDSDPVKAWKKSIEQEQDEEDDTTDESGPDFNYLLSMQIWSLTREKRDELLRNRDKKAEELAEIQKKTPKDLWKEDLENFLVALDELDEHERQEASAGAAITLKKKTKGKGGRQAKLTAGGSLKADSHINTKPSSFAEIITPDIPEYCAEKIKKERGRKPKVDPGQTKLQFKSSEDTKDKGEEEDENNDDSDTVTTKPDIIATKTEKQDTAATKKKAGTGATKKKAVLVKRRTEDIISDDDIDDDFVMEVIPPRKKIAKPGQSTLSFQPNNSKPTTKKQKPIPDDDPVIIDSPVKEIIPESPPVSHSPLSSASPSPIKKPVKARSTKTTTVSKTSKAPPAEKKTTARPQKKMQTFDFTSDEDDDYSDQVAKKTVKSPAKKKAPVKKTAQPVKKKAVKKKAVSDDDDDEKEEDNKSGDDEVIVARPKRQCKRIQYAFSDDDSRDDDESFAANKEEEDDDESILMD